MTQTSTRFVRTLLALLVLGYAIYFSIQLILHYQSFGSRALDLGNMGQSIWNTSQGRWFHQTNQPGATSRLSLHVEPILIPISLLYHLYAGPEILFIFQSVVVALGAIPVFALARLKLKNQGLALIFAILYLMLPAMQGATLLDFHAITLAPTFLLAAFYYMETDRSKYFALFAGLAVACKEDVTLLVMMMGLYALFINRQIRLGAITLALTTLWAFLAVFVIPPLFAGTDNIHWNRYEHLGGSPLEIVLNMALEPWRFTNHLQAIDAASYFRRLLAPTAYLALLSPATLLLALPSLGINLLSNFPPMQRVNSLIYAAPVVPALLISAIYGAARLKRWLLLAFDRVSHQRSKPLNRRRAALAINLLLGGLLLSASLLYHARFGFLPGGGQFRGWEEVTDHHRRAERIFAQIPPQAKLSAQDRLNPHVSRRETLYIFDRIDDANHILLDVTLDSWPLHPIALRDRVQDFLTGQFGVVDAFDGYLLLAKNQPNLPKTLPDAFFDFARVSNPNSFQPEFSTSVVFDDKLRLLGYDLSLGAHEKFLPVVTLYWQALEPLEQDYGLWPFFVDRNGQRIEDPGQRPLVATIWYPTSQWAPGEIIATRTLPFDLAPAIGDEFTVAVGVARDDWSTPAQRLPIAQIDGRLYTFENNTWARLGTFRRTGRKQYQPVTPQPTNPDQPQEATFGNVITLFGVDLPDGPLQPGQPLPFTLYWRSSSPISIDLTTFAHLRDQNGQTVAQLDWGPQDQAGYLPTSAWQPARPVIDQQQLLLPADLPAGPYRLVVGWYFPPTAERLPVTTSSDSGDTVYAGGITVE